MTPIQVAFGSGKTWRPASFVMDCAPTAAGGYRLTCQPRAIRETGKEVSITRALWRINDAVWHTVSVTWTPTLLYINVSLGGSEE